MLTLSFVIWKKIYQIRNEPGENVWKPTTSGQKEMMIWGEKMPHMGKPSTFKMWKTMLTKKNVGE